jgi:hypothetical protein
MLLVLFLYVWMWNPTKPYLWDWLAPVHAAQACSYLEYSNELDALVPSSVSTCISFLTVVTLWL